MHIFDIETNGFLEHMDTIHCLVVTDCDTGETLRFNDQGTERPLIEGIELLWKSDCIIGHNIVNFDIPAIQKIYPWFQPEGEVMDTLTMSRLIYPHLKQLDFGKRDKKYPDMPAFMIGRHSLASWGYRFHFPKDDYSDRMKEKGLDPWAEWNQEMEDYCVQDVMLNKKLWDTLCKQGFTFDSIQLEHDVRRIIDRQEAYGFLFDTDRAVKLQSTLLKRKLELTEELQEIFKPFYVKNGKTRVPKKTLNYKDVLRPDVTEGVEYTAIKVVEFNPGSRDHIANRLQRMYGWEPKSFGDNGKATVDESVLSTLNYPPAELLLEYLLVDKRLGQIAEGKEACLRNVGKDGRMHGRVDTMGAVTSRMTHSKPNVAQTPANYSPYGEEFRACYTVPVGKKLVGMDADALELRMLAGYMARWDKGEYIKVVLDGKKEDGTDIHTRNMHAIEIQSRDDAKTWFYAFIYGGGDFKLGTIIADSLGKKNLKPRQLIALGKKSRDNFEKNLPALGKLVKAAKTASKKRGKLRGLDGRLHPSRSEHSALNTLLQGAGAIIMKRALVFADAEAQRRGWVPGEHYEFVANIHDELQAEVDENLAEEFGQMLSDQLIKAGEYYDFACPITGGFDIGTNWSETH